jgi:hypothetical protein
MLQHPSIDEMAGRDSEGRKPAKEGGFAETIVISLKRGSFHRGCPEKEEP